MHQDIGDEETTTRDGMSMMTKKQTSSPGHRRAVLPLEHSHQRGPRRGPRDACMSICESSHVDPTSDSHG